MPPRTAIAAALDAAGYQPPEIRLNEIADAIVARTDFKTREAMIGEVARQISGDTGLLWALFRPFQNKAIGTLLEDAIIRRQKAKKASSSSGAIKTTDTTIASPRRTGGTRAVGPTYEQRERARREAAGSRVAAATFRALSKLDTFKINERPIGDCTPEEALAWRASRVRDSRYVWLICAGIPHGQRIRDHIKPEESDALYERASLDTGNE